MKNRMKVHIILCIPAAYGSLDDPRGEPANLSITDLHDITNISNVPPGT